ncbi:MAG: GNAT family N-acetyltransferase [Dehalococcoidia bacterium]|nr:GNAT family N-acetyltransferase [Dehalococcoidia bacterium]
MTVAGPRVVATGRLVRLREKHLDDAEHDFSWRRDPELASYDAARPITMSYRSFVASLREELEYPADHRRTFAIDDRATGTHIGNVMYYGYDRRTRQAELGITIGDRDYWSRGFGTDTVRTMLDYLFTELGLDRVILHTLTWNYRAQACFEQSGFERVKQVRRGGYDFIFMEAWAEHVDRPAAD